MDMFCEKMIKHGNGILLTFARTGNKTFQRLLREADAVLFLRKRIKFFLPNGEQGGSAGCDSALFAFGKNNVRALWKSGLEGVIITLRSI